MEILNSMRTLNRGNRRATSMRRRVVAAVVGVISLAGMLSGGSIAAGADLTPRLGAAHEIAVAPVVSKAAVVDGKLNSASLGREMGYSVYLPPGYESSVDQRYPVLYMLHGLGGSQHTWQEDGLFDTATAMINAGEIAPMIIVTPEGERGYWIDQANNGPRYGSYVAKDLVSAIDSQYRTEANRRSRAIGGMSMGAHGALQLAFNNPDEFGIVGAHSVALRTKDQAFSFFGDKAYFEGRDPVSLTNKAPGNIARFVIWLDIGNRDMWYEPALAFHRQLDAMHLPNLWQVNSGGHDDAYWAANMQSYLHFYDQAFASPGALFAQSGD